MVPAFACAEDPVAVNSSFRLPEFCGDIGGNGAQVCFGICFFDGSLINLCRE